MKISTKILLASAVTFLIACQSSQKAGETSAVAKSDILWNIISTQCVPHQKSDHNPAPCEEVTFPKNDGQGYVVLKDIKGRLQYLLMPAQKITGVDDPQILQSNSIHYFNEAWKARSYVSKKNGAPVSDDILALTINSAYGRSQNQLHIHISCIRPDVRSSIDKNQNALSKEWQKYPEALVGHEYYARKITPSELKRKNVFFLVSDQLTDAKEEMKKFGIAIVPLMKKGKTSSFVVLAIKANPAVMNFASAEELQDHDCPQLGPQK